MEIANTDDVMKTARMIAFWIVGTMLVVSCNKEKFAAGGRKAVQPEDHLVTINGIENHDAGYKSIAAIDTLDFSVQQTAFRTEKGQTSEIHAVDLYFVVDITASMTSELTNIRNSLPRITDNLRTKGVDLWAGFIGFVDGPSTEHTKILSDDISGLSTFIKNLRAEGNEDNEEGAIAAGKYAIDRFEMGDGRQDAVKIVLMITDVVGHDGSGSKNIRNCRISPFVNSFNQLSQKIGGAEKLKFFYTVPNPDNFAFPFTNQDGQMAHETCEDSETGIEYKAKSQMEAILAAINPNASPSQKGGPLLGQDGDLAWPIVGDVLSDTLVPMIETSVPTNRTLSCMAKEIKVLDDAKTELYTWKKTSQNLVPAINNAIYLDNVLNGKIKPQSGKTINLSLNISRCCMEVGSNNEPTSSQCLSEYVQKVQYRVIQR